jgi:LysM repeat protein
MVLLTAMLFAGPNSKFIYHTVEKGETLYSISHQYGLKPADVTQYNEAIGEKLTIKIGQKLKIPSPEGEIATSAVENTPVHVNNTPTPVRTAEAAPAAAGADQYHVVVKGETVFSISKMYGISKTDLLAWNKVKDNNIAVGQKLVIKGGDGSGSAHSTPQNSAPAMADAQMSKSDVQKAMQKDGYTWTLPSDKSAKTNVSTASGDVTASTSAGGLSDGKVVKSWKAESTSDIREYYNGKSKSYDAANDYESLFYQNIYSGMTKKTETGVAKFLTDNNTTNIAYYNNAAIGTILKLTNTDNGKTTYAIVVGKVAAAEENSYLMKLSGKVSRNLAAKDYSSIEIVCYTGN